MKKLIAVLVTAVLLLATQSVDAEWDCVVEEIVTSTEYLKTGHGTGRLKIECTSDASGYTYTIPGNDLRGAYVYALTTDPDDTVPPSAPYNISFADDVGPSLLNISGASTSTSEEWPAHATIGIFPLVFNPKLEFTTLGNGKKTSVLIKFEK